MLLSSSVLNFFLIAFVIFFISLLIVAPVDIFFEKYLRKKLGVNYYTKVLIIIIVIVSYLFGINGFLSDL
jgi:hypothetical protein